MTLREYIVTVKDFKYLDDFYEDMETPGGNLYIPDRKVDVYDRRPISRNTHYLLSTEEAEQIKNDPRVLSVELSMKEQGLRFSPSWTQNSTAWNKSNTISSNHLNWGLLRCVEGVQRANWGNDGTQSVSGEVAVTSSGKNVDVVIVDGCINPLHPEFAVNSDGTGGSRVNQFNWFSLNPLVTGGAAGNYLYTPYVDGTDAARTADNDHGAHVAGTACGNKYGWARDSNIYNINPYGTASSFSSNFLDYIRVWHNTKSVNSSTGFKNPTITNHSYGISYTLDITTINVVRHLGVIYNGPFTQEQLLNFGINNSGGLAEFPLRSTAYEADLIDMMNAGIIVVGAAGNEYSRINNFSASSSDYYNNYLEDSSFRYYYGRGTLTSANGAICVGGIGFNVDDSKLPFSNCGPRIDVYAPGRFIMSSVNSTTGTTTQDSRNASYVNTKKSGTSMASPQVAGVLACLAEQYPRINQAFALNYLLTHVKLNQITSTNGGGGDPTDIQDSPNRFLFYNKERKDSGLVTSNTNYGLRPASGMTFPRSKIYRY